MQQQRRSQGFGQKPALHIYDSLQGVDKPRLEECPGHQVLKRHLAPQCGDNRPKPGVVGVQRQFVQGIRGAIAPGWVFPEQGSTADFQRPRRLLYGGFKGAVDNHHLAGGLHLGGGAPVAAGKLVKRPPGYLHHAVVQRRLEGGQRLPCDHVRNLIQPLANRNLGRNPGDGITGGLAGKGRTAADPGIHLDDIVGRIRFPGVFRVSLDGLANHGMGLQCELHVATAFDAQLADYLEAGRPQHLVFAVAQGLAGRNHDAVSGMHSHGIQVFHVANGYAVVRPIPHNLILDLLPSHQGPLEQHLRNWAGRQAAGNYRLHFFPGICYPASGSSQRIRGAHHQRQTDFPSRFAGFFPGGN